METFLSIFKWLFFESVYGLMLIVAVTFGLAFVVKSFIPKSPNPWTIAIIVFFVGLFTVPSIPRYQFSNETLNNIDGKEWIRIINKENWGSVTEPLTWFNPPLGSIFIAMPYDPVTMGSFDYFQEVLIQYEEEDKLRIIQRFCTDNKIQIYKYDDKGTLRFATNMPQKMTEDERKRYCEYDWSKERDAIFDALKTN